MLVSLKELAALAEGVGLRTPAKVIAARLRATGWLLPTGQRSVYEFAPRFSCRPIRPRRSFMDLRVALSAGYPLSVALQSALWLYGMAERAPDRHELAAAPGSRVPASVRRRMRSLRFSAGSRQLRSTGCPSTRPARSWSTPLPGRATCGAGRHSRRRCRTGGPEHSR